MKQINVGLLGMGTVGSGVVKIFNDPDNNLSQKAGASITIKKILVRNPQKIRTADIGSASITTDINDILNDNDINLVVEVMGGEEPALSYMLRAMSAGKHIVTANKDVVAKHGRELFALAEKNRINFMFEASVAGGIPIIRPLKRCLAANKITEVMGIVNGTTNYMLTKMTAEGMDFAEALALAQEKGYAEADPTADIGGFDAARKIAILASIAFNSRVGLENVHVEGIEKITAEDIACAKELGYVIKLLAIAKENGGGISLRVHPTFISTHHPLASVNDVFNAIFIKGHAVGETMFYGRGAGEMPTASAIAADIIDTARDIQNNTSGSILCTCYNEKPIKPIGTTESAYYIRLLVEDVPGAFATLAAAFGSNKVSLYSVIQKRKVGTLAEIVLITHNIMHSNVESAINEIREMSIVNKVCNVIRVEGEKA